MNRRALSVVLVALALVAAACSGGSKDDSEGDASRPEDSTTLTTAAPTTTSTTAAAEPTQPSVVADSSGLGGVALSTPAGDLFDDLAAAWGPPTDDSGFIANDCFEGQEAGLYRWLRWSDFVVVLLQEGGQDPGLLGWYVTSGNGGDLPDPLEIRADVSLGMTWADLESRGAVWEYALWSLDGLSGTVGNDLVADSPPGDSVVTGFGAGATGVCA